MSLISLIPIIYNAVAGTNLSDVGTGIQYYVAWTTVGNHQGATIGTADQAQIAESLKHKMLNAIPAIVYSLVFVIFYFYWSWKSNRIT